MSALASLCVFWSWEVCMSSESSWIPLLVSPPFGTPMVQRGKFMSSIKASIMICFTKNSSNNCLGIDPHSDFIWQLSISPDSWHNSWKWKNNIQVTKALKGTSIAVVSLFDT